MNIVEVKFIAFLLELNSNVNGALAADFMEQM